MATDLHDCTYRKVGAICNTRDINAQFIHFFVDLSEGHDVVGALNTPSAVPFWIHRPLILRDAGETNELNVVVTEGTSVIELDISACMRAEQCKESCQGKEGDDEVRAHI